MNWFGKKKEAPTTVSATSTQRPADPQTTIVKLRESIANQEKREEHIARKIEATVKEAKAKMAKGDKKGTFRFHSVPWSHSVVAFLFTFFYNADTELFFCSYLFGVYSFFPLGSSLL